MTEEDLEWITNRNVGETIQFESMLGDIDTFIVRKIGINNSLNPINLSPSTGDKYLAYANIDYVIYHNHDSMEGHFCIKKVDNNEAVLLSAQLDSRYASDVKISFGILDTAIGDLTDYMRFDDNNSQNDKINYKPNPIVFFEWSRKYGLIRYGFKNRTIYKRKWDTLVNTYYLRNTDIIRYESRTRTIVDGR